MTRALNDSTRHDAPQPRWRSEPITEAERKRRVADFAARVRGVDAQRAARIETKLAAVKRAQDGRRVAA